MYGGYSLPKIQTCMFVNSYFSSAKKIRKNLNVNLRGACCTCNLHVEYLDLTNIHRKSFYIYNDQMQILFTTFKK